MFNTHTFKKGVPENEDLLSPYSNITQRRWWWQMTNGENDDGNDAVCDGDNEWYDGNIDDDEKDAVSQ